MTEKTVLLLGCLLVLGFALAAAALHTPRLEARLANDAAAALAARGLELEASASGRRIVLEGRVPDEETRRAAAAAVAEVAGIRGVVDHLEVAAVGPAEVGASPAGGETAPRAAPDRQAELDRVIGGRRIDFRKYGDELTTVALAVVTDVAAYLATAPEVAVEIAGYTDARGDLAGNYAISERRAAAVRRALIERGVAAQRLSSVGRGPEDPVADNDTAAGRRANRRVELSVVGPGS